MTFFGRVALQKENPYHDAEGKFTSPGNVGSAGSKLPALMNPSHQAHQPNAAAHAVMNALKSKLWSGTLKQHEDVIAKTVAKVIADKPKLTSWGKASAIKAALIEAQPNLAGDFNTKGYDGKLKLVNAMYEAFQGAEKGKLASDAVTTPYQSPGAPAAAAAAPKAAPAAPAGPQISHLAGIVTVTGMPAPTAWAEHEPNAAVSQLVGTAKALMPAKMFADNEKLINQSAIAAAKYSSLNSAAMAMEFKTSLSIDGNDALAKHIEQAPDLFALDCENALKKANKDDPAFFAASGPLAQSTASTAASAATADQVASMNAAAQSYFKPDVWADHGDMIKEAIAGTVKHNPGKSPGEIAGLVAGNLKAYNPTVGKVIGQNFETKLAASLGGSTPAAPKPAALQPVDPKLEAAKQYEALKGNFKTIGASGYAGLADQMGQRKFNDKESDAINSYKGMGYDDINSSLRAGRVPSLDVMRTVTHLDKVCAAGTLPADTMLYRGIGTLRDLEGDNKGVTNPETGFHKGKCLLDNGFVSTSTNPDFSKRWAKNRGDGTITNPHVLIEYKAPKGMNCAHVGIATGSKNDSESEILLPRGTPWKIVGVRNDVIDGRNFRRVTVEQVS